jgi:hypothetical protein
LKDKGGKGRERRRDRERRDSEIEKGEEGLQRDDKIILARRTLNNEAMIAA